MTFLYCIDQGAGKSAILNSLIGHPILVSLCFVESLLYFHWCISDDNVFLSFQLFCVFWQPTGGNGATRAPICVQLNRDSSLSAQAIQLLIDNKSQEVSASKAFYKSAA